MNENYTKNYAIWRQTIWRKQYATSSVIMDPNMAMLYMSIGDSMSFAFVLFLMTVHENENEMK